MNENIIELNVKYELHDAFRELVEAKGCIVKKVVEMINCKVLLYILNCPKEHESLVCDYGFMTWIKNPIFQKYYLDKPEFQQVAEKYILDNTEVRYVIVGEKGLMKWSEEDKWLFYTEDDGDYAVSSIRFIAETYKLSEAQKYINICKTDTESYKIYPVSLNNILITEVTY